MGEKSSAKKMQYSCMMELYAVKIYSLSKNGNTLLCIGMYACRTP